MSFDDLPDELACAIVNHPCTDDVDRTVLRCVNRRIRQIVRGPIVRKDTICAELMIDGRFSLLIWAHKTGCELDWTKAMLTVAKAKTITAEMLELLTYLHSLGFSLHSLPVYRIGYNDLKVFNKNVSVMCDYNCANRRHIDYITKIAIYAADDGRLDIIEWLDSYRYPVGFTIVHAAAAGHLGLVKWLYAKGFSWNVETAIRAARGGHLEVLKWMRGVDWNWDHHQEVCFAAAYGNHLETFEWLVANGCPWDRNTCRTAVDHHSKIQKWIDDHP